MALNLCSGTSFGCRNGATVGGRGEAVAVPLPLSGLVATASPTRAETPTMAKALTGGQTLAFRIALISI